MAKLSARDRTEYVRAEKSTGADNGPEILTRRAYMSDGTILENYHYHEGWTGWKVYGKWNRVSADAIRAIRTKLDAEGWTITKGDGPRLTKGGPS